MLGLPRRLTRTSVEGMVIGHGDRVDKSASRLGDKSRRGPDHAFAPAPSAQPPMTTPIGGERIARQLAAERKQQEAVLREMDALRQQVEVETTR